MLRILVTNLPLAGNYYLSHLLIQGVHLAASTLFRPQALLKLYWASRAGCTPREESPLVTITVCLVYGVYHDGKKQVYTDPVIEQVIQYA